MRRQLAYLSLIILVLMGTTLTAQEKQKSGRLDFTGMTFDFGMIPREAKVIHKFLLKNIGDDSLHILTVKPG